MNKRRVYALGAVSANKAWTVAAGVFKPVPYAGYALDLKNGQHLVCRKDGTYEIVVFNSSKEHGVTHE